MSGKPDSIPQDVWDAATACMEKVGWHANSMFIGAARGIMAERRRAAATVDAECARILAAIDGKYPNVDDELRTAVVLLPDLADAIRNGVPK